MNETGAIIITIAVAAIVAAAIYTVGYLAGQRSQHVAVKEAEAEKYAIGRQLHDALQDIRELRACIKNDEDNLHKYWLRVHQLEKFVDEVIKFLHDSLRAEISKHVIEEQGPIISLEDGDIFPPKREYMEISIPRFVIPSTREHGDLLAALDAFKKPEPEAATCAK